MDEADWPWFIHSVHVRDSEGRRPDHPDYDPSTLLIHDTDFAKLSPGMQRYWGIKKNNYDKILFYRFGEWFMVYYRDADICHKNLDMTIRPGSRQTEFHQRFLTGYIEKLVALGYKVAVCEQTETSHML